ncbi:MAG: hypothetical protein R2688_00145 [Fimbriimonadaceae bacterium]
MDAWHTAGDYLASKPVSNQPPYNMFQRDIERDDLHLRSIGDGPSCFFAAGAGCFDREV